MKNLSRLLLSVVAVLLTLGTARADNVELELSALTEDVVKILAKQDQKSISVGPFAGKGKVKSNFGPEIQRLLIQELKRRKITPDPDALVEITGDYRDANEDPDAPALKEVFLRINAQLVNTKTGRPLDKVDTISRAVYGNAEVSRAFAIPVSLPPDGTRKDRNEEIKKRLTQRDCHIDGSKIASRPGSPFLVEILAVADKDAPDPPRGREAAKEGGLPFVPIRRGEFYRVKITNNAPFDVAVKLSIDGLDQFVFINDSMTVHEKGQRTVIPLRDPKTGKPRYNYRVIPKGQSGIIRGWFRDLSSFDYFAVTEYAKSAAKELNALSGDVGQIVVQFHACWEKDEDQPRDERTGEKSAGPDATGRVPGGKENAIEVKRTVGVLRDNVAIRYTKEKQ